MTLCKSLPMLGHSPLEGPFRGKCNILPISGHSPVEGPLEGSVKQWRRDIGLD